MAARRPAYALLLAPLALLLCGGLALILTLPGHASVRIDRAAGGGAVFLWTELDPHGSWLAIQRIRLIPGGPAARARLWRSSSNSLPPLTISDPDARPGDCFLAQEGVRQSGATGAPIDLVIRTQFVGCLTP